MSTSNIPKGTSLNIGQGSTVLTNGNSHVLRYGNGASPGTTFSSNSSFSNQVNSRFTLERSFYGSRGTGGMHFPDMQSGNARSARVSARNQASNRLNQLNTNANYRGPETVGETARRNASLNNSSYTRGTARGTTASGRNISNFGSARTNVSRNAGTAITGSARTQSAIQAFNAAKARGIGNQLLPNTKGTTGVKPGVRTSLTAAGGALGAGAVPAGALGLTPVASVGAGPLIGLGSASLGLGLLVGNSIYEGLGRPFGPSLGDYIGQALSDNAGKAVPSNVGVPVDFPEIPGGQEPGRMYDVSFYSEILLDGELRFSRTVSSRLRGPLISFYKQMVATSNNSSDPIDTRRQLIRIGLEGTNIRGEHTGGSTAEFAAGCSLPQAGCPGVGSQYTATISDIQITPADGLPDTGGTVPAQTVRPPITARSSPLPLPTATPTSSPTSTAQPNTPFEPYIPALPDLPLGVPQLPTGEPDFIDNPAIPEIAQPAQTPAVNPTTPTPTRRFAPARNIPGNPSKVSPSELDPVAPNEPATVPSTDPLQAKTVQENTVIERLRRIQEEQSNPLTDLLIPGLAITPGLRQNPGTPLVPERKTNPGTNLPQTGKSGSCGCNGGINAHTDDVIGQLDKRLNDKLDALQQGSQNAQLAAILAKLLEMENFAKKAWQNTHLDKLINLLTLVTVLHNGAMISRDIGETLGYVVSNALAAIGVKDEGGNALDINELVGGSIENFIKSVVGEDVYEDTRTAWQKANRVLQAGSNIIWTLRSINDTTQDVMEWTAENTGKIGNALKKWGVVGERAYPWMSERVKAQDFYRRKFSRVFDGLETAENTASSLAVVTSDVREIQEEVTELGEARTRFTDAVTAFGPEDTPGLDEENQLPTSAPENQPIQVAEEDAEGVSQSPNVAIATDAQRGDPPDDDTP
ncbi:hypothetical protein Lepto7375DRAFT_4567 [Leptolyngbya sp. PCC 7375]|nr:hypothetical protein Lepto7375DRAFT_4567 [Leptolyngbya sp. PCC 7375]